MKNLMLLEDDANLGESLTRFLKNEGYQVNWVKSLQEFRDNYNDENLLILDWMLPDGQGIDLLKEIRSKNKFTPVILLTARAELIDKVIGLEAGANDYVTKPFEPRELLARIRVQLRHDVVGSNDADKSILEKHGIKMIETSREVFYKEQLVDMTKMEYELLRLFLENPGRAFSREEILNKVWGYENYPTTRTVDTHILQLRNKFGENLFETLRGVGYRLIP
jgi:DNA-binding response OmpR family regulator